MHNGQTVPGAAVLINCQVVITCRDAQTRTAMRDLTHGATNGAPLVILGGGEKLLLADTGGRLALR